MKKKSIKVNALLNIIQTLMSILFPIITFPYASRVLGVEAVGKYNFSSSIVSYFVLLASLGIGTYAVREGARVRDKQREISSFIRDVFSINIYSTLFAYILMIIIVYNIDLLHPYWKLIAILALQIVFSTLGRNWIYTIYEDYFFITIRSILFQLVNMVLLFIMVHGPADVERYAFVSVFGLIGNNIANMICSRKYCTFSFTLRPAKKHILPILLIFSTTVSIVIYGSSDTTMLGIFGTDYNVGIYSVSVKIYSIIKQLVAAVLTVSIPRFSYYLGNGKKEEYNQLFDKVINLLLFILLPISIGLCMVSKQCIYLISGLDYLDAASPLSILSIAMIFNLLAYMLGYCVLIPNRKEKQFFIATLVSAIVNIGLNYIFIPQYMQNAAATTTLIAEAVAAIMCFGYSYQYIRSIKLGKNVFCSFVGTILIVIICLFINNEIEDYLLSLALCVIVSIFAYLLLQVILKNPLFHNIISIVKEKIRMYAKMICGSYK